MPYDTDIHRYYRFYPDRIFEGVELENHIWTSQAQYLDR